MLGCYKLGIPVASLMTAVVETREDGETDACARCGCDVIHVNVVITIEASTRRQLLCIHVSNAKTNKNKLKNEIKTNA